MELNTTIQGNSLEELKKLPDESVHTCVTSPPYYGLRDYGTPPVFWPAVMYRLHGFTINIAEITCSLGLEETPEAFIGHLVLIFTEVRRVLRKDGTLWLNIGDSYWGGKGSNENTKARNTAKERGAIQSGGTVTSSFRNLDGKHAHIKAKDLIGIPWMLAFALREVGWYLRQDNIWAKPNPMPESVRDRCTKSHEYLFLFSKSQKYYYDQHAIMRDVTLSSIQRLQQDVENQEGSNRAVGKTNGTMKAKASRNGSTFKKGKTGEVMETRGGTRSSGNKERKDSVERGCPPPDTGSNVCGNVPWKGAKANKRSVWHVQDNYATWDYLFANAPVEVIAPLWEKFTADIANKPSVWSVTTRPFTGAHFATFPPDLIEDCIKAGCPEYVCNKCGAPRLKIFEKEKIGHVESDTAYAEGMTASRLAQKRQAYREQGMEGPPPEKVKGLTDCGCNAGFSAGIVLEPFSGAGTTKIVSRLLHRNCISIELNPEYIRIDTMRSHNELGLFT